jgi:Tfp pilus assembly protein PilO
VKNQTNTKALILFSMAVLAMGGGATYFQYNTVQEAKARAAELQAQVPSQDDLERNLSESQTKLTEYQAKLAHLEGSVPDVAYIPTLMKELERIGIEHGIVVTGVRPAPIVAAPTMPGEGTLKEAKKDYSEVQIEIKGRGRYDDIKSLLDALQKFPKVIAVKTVGLSPMRDTAQNSVTHIEVVINVVAYVFPFELLTAANPTPANPALPNPKSGSSAIGEASDKVTNSDQATQTTSVISTETHKVATGVKK